MRSVLLLLAACSASPAAPDAVATTDGSNPDAPPIDAAIDAPGAALGCLGQPPPATAPDPLLVEGKLFAVDHYEVTPLATATVVLRRRSDATAIDQAMTAGDGSFAITVASGGTPIDSYFTVAVAGYRPSVVDPGDPLSGGENALLLVATDAELARWYADAGATFDPGAATLVTANVDCDRHTLDDSTVAIAPAPGSITHYDASTKRWDASLATSTNGFALVTAPQSSVVATAHLGAIALPAQTILVAAGSLTIRVLGPRAGN